jgi:hypothetical protein
VLALPQRGVPDANQADLERLIRRGHGNAFLAKPLIVGFKPTTIGEEKR